MQAVKAIFDGKNIRPINPVNVKKTTEVLVIFPADEIKCLPGEARKRLRGAGKGELLTEKLLKSRAEDCLTRKDLAHKIMSCWASLY